jgi:hypothetical protein
VPKVSSIKIDGYDLKFMSSDHMPPHFHWEKAGKWAVRVYFTRGGEKTFDIIFGPGPTGAEMKMMRQQIEGRLEKLLKEWEKKVKVDERLKNPKGAK